MYLGRQVLDASTSPRVLVDRDVLHDLVEHVQAAEDLEENVYSLRQELGINKVSGRLAALSGALRLTEAEADFLLILFDAGRSMRRESLFRAHYVEHYSWGGNRKKSDHSNIKIVDTYISNVRKKIGADAVKTNWGLGYELTVRGHEIVAAALGEQ